MKGTEAIAEAAIRAGCRLYFGYPITPQSELTEYMAKRMPEVKGVFLQSESEVATVNMLYGAACTGKRVMTSTSSPGFSLMQEGISYMAGAELPAVFINVMRGGPGLGDIQPSQSDYFQSTKGGGHGDYRMIVLAPHTLQEAANIMGEAFDLAFKYRMLVTILVDGMIGQMMEPVELPEWKNIEELKEPDWALTGAKGRKPRKVTSFDLDPYELEKMNLRYQATYKRVAENEVRYEEFKIEDADIIVVAYGTMARIVKTVADSARKEGIRVGLFRPITLWPFPYERLSKISQNVKHILTVEMSYGQMIEDVKLAVNGKTNVDFYGRSAGVVPTPMEVLEAIKKIAR
ncbi:3-methyl-2-oxobutanoate dehydrogenase subunit VorB [Athalassotoga saccharophila]|uniref:3-methyl-2-oxobutanoate dehydrogenase subunit VorB n=1 Tax=Athalassotoga saccharophila TaxID=1441386 RepID=UPI001E610BB5|nr:3-methyl-2-oxobutanoate dehydrogenase subunit VorB [Athalassotoga saccharophila]